MMHTCESITNELLRYERQAVAVALFALIRREGSPGSDALDRISRKIGDAAGQVACLIPIVCATGRVKSVFSNAGHFQCFVVVVRGVAATMTHDDRMIHRDFVQIGGVEFALVFYLRIVEEISVDPRSGWRFFRARTKLFNNAGDRDKFNLVRISDENFIEQRRSWGVIMAVDETR